LNCIICAAERDTNRVLVFAQPTVLVVCKLGQVENHWLWCHKLEVMLKMETGECAVRMECNIKRSHETNKQKWLSKQMYTG